MNVKRILSRKIFFILIIAFTCIFSSILATNNKTRASNEVTWQLASTGLPGVGTAFATAFGTLTMTGKRIFLLDTVMWDSSYGPMMAPQIGEPRSQ